MLQPPQLKDVSSRYVEEISELQSFLTKAGVPVATPQAFGSIALRVQTDRAFHRDLTANLWVTTEGWERQIGFADLLGVLAIAASGIQFASDAEEQDAMTLLRFLKEIRPTRGLRQEVELDLNSAPVTSPHSPRISAEAAEQVGQAAEAHVQAAPRVHEPQLIRSRPGKQTELPRKRSRWIAAGACSALVFVLVVGLYRRSLPPSPVAPQSVALGSAEGASHGGMAEVPIASGRERVDHELLPMQPKVLRSGDRGASIPKPLQPAIAKPAKPLPAHVETQPTRAAVLASDVRPLAPAAALPNSLPVPQTTATASASPLITGHTVARPTNTAPVPASTLSARLGAPTLPPYATSPNDDAGVDVSRRPRLLRRHPTVNANSTLVAGLQPINNPMRSAGGQPALSTGQSVGSVRPTALGMMAANVLYSPAPAYPIAASAAHVTGEVKLEAEVDRDGNVTYARVVSGPPLLRDAALNALQQWKYRPFLSRGKAVPKMTLAVMDFQIP